MENKCLWSLSVKITEWSLRCWEHEDYCLQATLGGFPVTSVWPLMEVEGWRWWLTIVSYKFSFGSSTDYPSSVLLLAFISKGNKTKQKQNHPMPHKIWNLWTACLKECWFWILEIWFHCFRSWQTTWETSLPCTSICLLARKNLWSPKQLAFYSKLEGNGVIYQQRATLLPFLAKEKSEAIGSWKQESQSILISRFKHITFIFVTDLSCRIWDIFILIGLLNSFCHRVMGLVLKKEGTRTHSLIVFLMTHLWRASLV